MKNKKTIMIVALVSIMVLGVAFMINSSMSYAKNYDKLVDGKNKLAEEGFEKRKNGEPRTYMTINDFKYEVDYMDGVDIEEGITAIKGVEKGMQKIKEIYGENIEIYKYLYIWDYDEHDELPTLESQASWGIAYTFTIPSISQTQIYMEVDKYTGTCVEKSKEVYNFSDEQKPTAIGEHNVYVGIGVNINEGITVEKALTILQEKAKKIFNVNLPNELSISEDSTVIEDKEVWGFGMGLEPGRRSTALLSASMDKDTGEILYLNWQSSERFNRLEEFFRNEDEYWAKDIDTEADGDTVKARVLEYLAGEKNSKYHQIAIDFVKNNNINQGANIVKAQTVLNDCGYMLQVEGDIASWKYLVEVELDNGKFIIVMIEKGVDSVFGYEITPTPFAKRLDYWTGINDKMRKYYQDGDNKQL